MTATMPRMLREALLPIAALVLVAPGCPKSSDVVKTSLSDVEKTSLPAAAGTQDQGKASGLADLIRQFRCVKSLSFDADAELLVHESGDDKCLGKCLGAVPPRGTPISGRLEYRVADDRYRINSWAEPDKLPGMQFQLAYDGRRFQVLLPNGVLSCSSRDTAAGVPVLPNPLLELLQFRYPVTDENAHLMLRLKDVRNDEDLQEFFQVEWGQVGDGSLERAVFPGGTYEGRPYVHHVYAAAGRHHMPVRIDRVREGGILATSAAFFDYERLESDCGPTFWPRRVALMAFTPQGRPAIEISFTLRQLAVDVEFDADVFVIDPNSASRIWDDDRREFVLRPGEAGPACRPGPGPVNRPASGEQASVPAATSVGTVLDQWTAGRHEEAISTLVAISESHAAPACYRPFDITEPQFVALPQAEREALREKMLAGLVVLRKIARELDRRAREAAAAGDPERAAKLLEVMKRLGAANRGPEVTRVVDLVGQAIEELAERGLSELSKQTTADPPPSAGNPPGP